MGKVKTILGIESSCDETAAAVVQTTSSGVKILSNIVASSADLQAKYGGVIPEQAAREQLKSIIPVIQESLNSAHITHGDLDAVAVTQGPGLIGSLLVGVETAKTLTLVWNKPLIPVNHLIGHFYANWISVESRVKSQGSRFSTPTTPSVLDSIGTLATNDFPQFPAIGLLVSGGHTDLILMKDHGKYEYLGGTRDDAAGEAFDKTARLLGLSYPGGPVIAKLAETGNPNAFKLPKPMIDSKDFDFSFSGLKTAVANLPIINEGGLTATDQANLAAAVQETIVMVLVKKTIQAAQIHNVDHIIVAGGVAANQKLSQTLKEEVSRRFPRATVHIPPPKLCTDNAAYIAAAAFYNYHPVKPLDLQANPNLSLN